jgi:hypothetical protein
MTTITKLSVARQKTFDDFYNGATVKDAAQICSALTDDFTMKGPMMTFTNPDAFVESLLGFDCKVTESKLIVDGDDLVHLHVLDIGKQIPMCDVITFRGDKFASMVLYTDSKLFDPEQGH